MSAPDGADEEWILDASGHDQVRSLAELLVSTGCQDVEELSLRVWDAVEGDGSCYETTTGLCVAVGGFSHDLDYPFATGEFWATVDRLDEWDVEDEG